MLRPTDPLDGSTWSAPGTVAGFAQSLPNAVLMTFAGGHRAGIVSSELEREYASDVPRSLTVHDIGLKDVIEAAALLGPLPKTHLTTVSVTEPRSMDLTLSRAARAAIPDVLAAVRRCLGAPTAH